MVASSIMMGRALAPVEVALGSWKQLVAARQGIARLRDICKVTANLPRRRSRCRGPAANCRCRRLPSSRPAPTGRSCRIFPFHWRPARDWRCSAPARRARPRFQRHWWGSGRPRAVWSGSTVPPSSSGAMRISDVISAICRRTCRCSTARSPKISAASTRGATSEAILKAAQIAGVHDIILRLPQGYATRIGQGGMSLSAGQRQRIGLARALFGDPFLVVLDEPNANLDADGENALSRAIKTLRSNRSIVIVISHRPSALAALNMAMVLYKGNAIAFGTCEEIFARSRRERESPRPRAIRRRTDRSRDGRRRNCRDRLTMPPAFNGTVCRGHSSATRMPNPDAHGPQGAALVLELQKLRRASTIEGFRTTGSQIRTARRTSLE